VSEARSEPTGNDKQLLKNTSLNQPLHWSWLCTSQTAFWSDSAVLCTQRTPVPNLSQSLVHRPALQDSIWVSIKLVGWQSKSAASLGEAKNATEGGSPQHTHSTKLKNQQQQEKIESVFFSQRGSKRLQQILKMSMQVNIL